MTVMSSGRLSLKCVALATVALTSAGMGTSSFPCDLSQPWNQPSSPVPSSVHKLRPADIRVVAAMGDSQTAAFGAKAKTLIQQYGEPLEYRGYSWSCGGAESYEDDVTTIPNILKQFTRGNLTGFATHNTLPGEPFRQSVGFDVAVSGDVAPGMPNQAKRLIKLMKDSKEISLADDWKLLSIWIGGNDECVYCYDNHTYSASEYKANIVEALEMLRASVPRLFVNLVGYIDVSTCASLNSSTCTRAHDTVCPCMSRPEGRAAMTAIAAQYMDAAYDIAKRYQHLDNFTVVVQPTYKGFKFPSLDTGLPDYSYTAPDCFHYSVKGHSNAGVGIFKSLMEPVGAKQWPTQLPVKLSCPTQSRQWLATFANSK